MKRFLVPYIMVVLFLPLLLMSTAAQDDSTLVGAFASDVQTFNSLLWGDSTSATVAGYLWPQLFQKDPITGATLPALASWEISEDGLTYTFTLQEGVMWSDGAPLTANDVKFTMEALKSENVQSSQAGQVAAVESITVVDDTTLEVTLTAIDCTFLDGFTLGILPAHRFAEDYSDFMDNELNRNPDISGGPWILTERAADEFLVFEANPNYWRGQPQIQNLILRIIPEATVRQQALLTGEIDWVSIASDEAAEYAGEGFNIVVLQIQRLAVLAMNIADPSNPQNAYDAEGNPIDQGHHPIFGDVRVRQAVAMGYDKDAIVASGPEGTARIVGPVAPVVTWAYNDEVTPFAYDPDAANAMLEEAGWVDADGDGVRECQGCLYAEEGAPLSFTLFQTPTGGALADTSALVIQDQLRALGMEVNLETKEFGAVFQDDILAQTFDAFITPLGWGNSDPHTLTNVMLNSSIDAVGAPLNFVSYSNPEVDALIEQARTVPGCGIEERGDIYKEIQRIAYEDVAFDWVWTEIAGSYVAFNPRIQNVNPYDQPVWALAPINEWTLSN
ncbi:MAG: peptide-binding protein [Anaerolineae bacterium]